MTPDSRLSLEGPQYVEVQPRGQAAAVPIGGTIVPYREVTLTAQFPGRIEFIAGEEGHRFSEGKVLVKIDDEEMLAQRRAAEAQIANAQASVRNAGVQYHRELRSPSTQQPQGGMMNPMGMMPFMGGDKGDTAVDRRATLYSFGTQMEQAQAALFQAQSRLQEIDAKLKDAASVAPFDGAIMEKFVNVGDTVQPGQPLVSFGDVQYLQVQLDVPVRLVSALSPGMPVPVRLDNAARSLVNAPVAQIFPKADAVRHTVRVKLNLPQGSGAAAGMYAEVFVPDPARASLMANMPSVPFSAIVWRGGLPMAYALRPDGGTELRLLRLGEKVDQDHVVVLTGLAIGEKILANPKN
jgi:multidrug efflux pump subunit AcrA (membrane-fusion protein)